MGVLSGMMSSYSGGCLIIYGGLYNTSGAYGKTGVLDAKIEEGRSRFGRKA